MFFKRMLMLGTAFAFGILVILGSAPLWADALTLPEPGQMVNLSPAFEPASLQGLVIHPENPLKFDFIIGRGKAVLSTGEKQAQYTKLIKYFLASLAVADQDQWVNLSPYEKNRIIEADFGKTEMGRDLLAQDYLLKQITSSLVYPEKKLGKEFWRRIYEQVGKNSNIRVPINTFNKVWIMPDKAVIYQKANAAFVVRTHLKVMLEEDYLALSKRGGTDGGTSKIMREIVLPVLEREINTGKNFTILRQVYSSMLLAAWYKRTLKESLLGKAYADKGKVQGLEQADSTANQAIYQRYVEAFKKGVFNYIKDDTDIYHRQLVPRKYFAGGTVGFVQYRRAVTVERTLPVADRAVLAQMLPQADAVTADLAAVSDASADKLTRNMEEYGFVSPLGKDRAMASLDPIKIPFDVVAEKFFKESRNAYPYPLRVVLKNGVKVAFSGEIKTGAFKGGARRFIDGLRIEALGRLPNNHAVLTFKDLKGNYLKVSSREVDYISIKGSLTGFDLLDAYIEGGSLAVPDGLTVHLNIPNVGLYSYFNMKLVGATRKHGTAQGDRREDSVLIFTDETGKQYMLHPGQITVDVEDQAMRVSTPAMTMEDKELALLLDTAIAISGHGGRFGRSNWNAFYNLHQLMWILSDLLPGYNTKTSLLATLAAYFENYHRNSDNMRKYIWAFLKNNRNQKSRTFHHRLVSYKGEYLKKLEEAVINMGRLEEMLSGDSPSQWFPEIADVIDSYPEKKAEMVKHRDAILNAIANVRPTLMATIDLLSEGGRGTAFNLTRLFDGIRWDYKKEREVMTGEHRWRDYKIVVRKPRDRKRAVNIVAINPNTIAIAAERVIENAQAALNRLEVREVSNPRMPKLLDKTIEISFERINGRNAIVISNPGQMPEDKLQLAQIHLGDGSILRPHVFLLNPQRQDLSQGGVGLSFLYYAAKKYGGDVIIENVMGNALVQTPEGKKRIPVPYVRTIISFPDADKAMTNGGIDMNAGHVDLAIQKDGPDPSLKRQNWAAWGQIQGLVPHIISIKPAVSLLPDLP